MHYMCEITIMLVLAQFTLAVVAEMAFLGTGFSSLVQEHIVCVLSLTYSLFLFLIPNETGKGA